MTIRDHIKRKVHWCYLAMLLAMALFFLTEIPKPKGPLSPLSFLAPVPLFALGMYMIFGIKCPKCKTRVGMLASQAFMPLAIMKPTFNYCPGCGVSLDTPLDGRGQ